MLSDFELITHEFRGGHDITIIPISDVHLGAAECMEQEFISFVETVRNSENVYITLGGDLLNNATKSSVSNIYDEVYRPIASRRSSSVGIIKKYRSLCKRGGFGLPFFFVSILLSNWSVKRSLNRHFVCHFSRAIDGQDPGKVWPGIDELMTATYVYNRPLYDATMRRLE